MAVRGLSFKCTKKTALEEHMLSHKSRSRVNKVYQCEFCADTLTSAMLLKKHKSSCTHGTKNEITTKKRKGKNIDQNFDSEVTVPNLISQISETTSGLKEQLFTKVQSLLDESKSPERSENNPAFEESVLYSSSSSSSDITDKSNVQSQSDSAKKKKKTASKTFSVKNSVKKQSAKRSKKVQKIVKQSSTGNNVVVEKSSNDPQIKMSVSSKLPVSNLGTAENPIRTTAAIEAANLLEAMRIAKLVAKQSNSKQKYKLADVKEEASSPKESEDEQADEAGNVKKLTGNQIDVDKAKFTCTKCSKTFCRKYHLNRHLKLYPCSGLPPSTYPCQVCNRVYSRKDNLLAHLRAHTGESHRKKKYKCTCCGKAFHGMSLLTNHMRKHTGEKPFSCDFCPKLLSSAGALAVHRRIHTGEKPFCCPECGVRFSLTGTLNQHMRVHTGVRPHQCPYCGKQFIQVGGLKAHLFYHTGENGFKCEECDKVFNRKARLQMHKLSVHVKHKPYACEHCPKSFTRKEDLQRHSVMHTGEKPYTCPTCNKSFSIKPALKLHLLTHTKEEPRSCHECGRAFIRKDCLLRHMRKCHSDLPDKILLDEKDEKFGETATVNSRMLSEEDLCENIQELLSLLVEESTLVNFGWPKKPVDEVLEAVIRRCGHAPVDPDLYSYKDRMRENAKLLFTVVIDDNAVKTLFSNQTVDEIILHVIRLAKT